MAKLGKCFSMDTFTIKEKLHINNMLHIKQRHAARCMVQTDLLAKRTRTEHVQYQGHRCING